MSEDYDAVTAFHYAAFRPALHNRILSKCLNSTPKHNNGLDIGCGTGQSAIALTNYCHKVVGIDPSADMLSKTISHPRVKYLEHNDPQLPFLEQEFDIITFAGSWYYAKSQILLDEVFRVSKPGAIIVLYDFEISLRKLLMELGVPVNQIGTVIYDHDADFSGLNNDAMEYSAKVHETMMISLKTEQLSHLLLAQKDQYELLEGLLGSDHLFENTKNQLRQLEGKMEIEVPANLYYTIYHRLET